MSPKMKPVEMERQERARRRREFLVSWVAIFLGLMGTVVGFFYTLNGRLEFPVLSRIHVDEGAGTRDLLREQAAEFEKQRADLQRSIIASQEMQQAFLQAARRKGAVVYKEGLSPGDRARLQKLAATQDDLGRQLAVLDDAIMQTPEKAVAIPVLKQQISDLEDKYRGDNDAMHAEMGHLYTMMSIFFGSMVALIVGVGGLFFNIFKHRSDRPPHEDNDNAPSPTPAAAAGGTTG